MTALDFWKQFGTPITREVCGLAGTTFEYFEHIAHGRKRASEDLAKEISNAAQTRTGVAIDVASMRPPKEQSAISKRAALRKQRAAAFSATIGRATL